MVFLQSFVTIHCYGGQHSTAEFVELKDQNALIVVEAGKDCKFEDISTATHKDV